MADVQVNVKVDAKQADTSLKGLKKELKELRDAQANVTQGSGEWKKLAKQINDVEGQLGDLNDSFTTLRGSGIERVNASIGLLGEGFRNFDTEKIKIGFQGVGAAMKAIPIFLIAEGVRLLIENFEEVTKFFKQFFDVASEGEKNLKKLNKELEQTQQQNNILTKAIDSQIKVLEAQGASEERILALKAKGNQLRIKELEQQQAINKAKLVEALANDSVTDSLLRFQIATLRKIGKDKEADALERAIFKSRLNENKELVKSIEETALAINEVKTNQNVEEIKFNKKNADERLKDNEALNKKIQDQQIELIKNEKKREESKLMLDLERQKEDIKKSKANREIKNKALLLAEETYQKNLADINKKFADKAEEERKKAEEEEKKRLADIASNNKAQQEQALNELKNLLALRLEVTAQGSEEQLNARLNQLETEKQLELQKYAEGTEERILLEQKFQERKDALQREFRMKQIKEDLETASNSISSLQGLSDTFFAIQQANQKEGSEEAERNAKKQFQINKSLQIGAAVVNGLQSILAITSVPDFTLGVATATRIAAQVALNAATIAKIAGQQYKSSSSGAGNVQTPRNNTPSVSTPTPQQTTLPGQDGTFIQPDNKVYVLESDITKTQGRVARVGEQSKF